MGNSVQREETNKAFWLVNDQRKSQTAIKVMWALGDTIWALDGIASAKLGSCLQYVVFSTDCQPDIGR